MSKITENREVYLCHVLLSHYRFIKKMNEMKMDEFLDFICQINPSIFSAYKNKDFKNAKSIIADYISIIEKTILSMKDKCKNRTDDNCDSLHRSLSIIRLKYINKKELSKNEIEKKLGFGENYCKYIIEALTEYAKYFNRTAERLNYKNALTNRYVRVIEIARLANKAKKIQELV